MVAQELFGFIPHWRLSVIESTIAPEPPSGKLDQLFGNLEHGIKKFDKYSICLFFSVRVQGEFYE